MFSRVGGLEPQPLIYKVIGETQIKQIKENGFPGSVGPARGARGNSIDSIWRLGGIGEAHLNTGNHSIESGDRGSYLLLSLQV